MTTVQEAAAEGPHPFGSAFADVHDLVESMLLSRMLSLVRGGAKSSSIAAVALPRSSPEHLHEHTK
jgi:hypothetical protein